MSKHLFIETTTKVKDSQYHRLIYCQWCGLVVWNFNKYEGSLELQKKVGKPCVGNDSQPTKEQSNA